MYKNGYIKRTTFCIKSKENNTNVEVKNNKYLFIP